MIESNNNPFKRHIHGQIMYAGLCKNKMDIVSPVKPKPFIL